MNADFGALNLSILVRSVRRSAGDIKNHNHVVFYLP